MFTIKYLPAEFLVLKQECKTETLGSDSNLKLKLFHQGLSLHFVEILHFAELLFYSI
jgi:hypothetical protein